MGQARRNADGNQPCSKRGGKLQMRRGGRGHGYSACIPAVLTTFVHLTTSALTNSVYCSGVVVVGSLPTFKSFSRTSGAAMMRFNSRFNWSISARGVLAGAANPYQFDAW